MTSSPAPQGHLLRGRGQHEASHCCKSQSEERSPLTVQAAQPGEQTDRHVGRSGGTGSSRRKRRHLHFLFPLYRLRLFHHLLISWLAGHHPSVFSRIALTLISHSFGLLTGLLCWNRANCQSVCLPLVVKTRHDINSTKYTFEPTRQRDF